MATITVLKDKPDACSTTCQFARVDFIDQDCYAFACHLFDGKPLGWYPRLKRLQECIDGAALTEKEKNPDKQD